MSYPSPDALKDLVLLAAKRSDMHVDALLKTAQLFVDAHNAVPGGLSIEIGSRIGGTAVMFAELLKLLYIDPPQLWTVDPYGNKPYVGGEHNVLPPLPLYTDKEFVELKSAMAGYPFHTHWKLESHEFFSRLNGAGYWTAGVKELVAAGGGKEVRLRIGEKRVAGRAGAAFILLDGEHSMESIDRDVADAVPWLATQGVLVVDNIDADRRTVGRLKANWAKLFREEDFSRAFAIGRLS